MTKFYEHPEYEENEDSWETYHDLYEGDHKKLISPKYLWMHELEYSQQTLSQDPMTGTTDTVGEKIRRIRCQRSRYYNLFEPVVSTWIAMALSKPMRLNDELIAMLGEDINDIDGKGTNLFDFILCPIAISYFRDGKSVILADAPSDPTVAGFRPTLEVLDVLDVKDWQYNDDGSLDLLRYEYTVVKPRESLDQEPKECEYCKVYSRNYDGTISVSIYEEDEESRDWKFLESYDIPLNMLPISIGHNNEPWVKDVAEQQLVLFNLDSSYYNQLNTQAFQRVFVSGDLEDKHLISISEYAVSVLPPEAKPYVIEPANTDPLERSIRAAMDKLYRVAFNRTRGVSSDSREAPGASTLREMSTELITLLVQAVGQLESITNRAIMDYAKFKLGEEKAKDFKGRIEFSRDITADDITMQLQMFIAYRDSIMSISSWKKAHLKKVAVSMGYNVEERQEILKDIEEDDQGSPTIPIGGQRSITLPTPRVRDSEGK